MRSTSRFRVLRDTLTLLGQNRRWRWVVLVLLALTIAVLEAVGALLIYVLMGLIAAPSGDVALPVVGDLNTVFPGASREALLLAVAGGVAGFFVVRGAIVVGQAYVQTRLIHNAAANLSGHLVRGYLAMPYLVHTQRNSAELVRNSFDSVQALTRQVMGPLTRIVAESVVVTALLGVLIWASPAATLLVVIVFAPLLWLLLRVVQPHLKRLGRRAQTSKRESLKAVQQALGGVRDIKLLGRESHFADVFWNQRRELARATYLREALTNLPRAMIETTLVVTVVAVFAIAVLRGEGVEELLSALGVFAYVGLRLQPSLRTIVQALNDLKFGTAVLDDLIADRSEVDTALDAQGNTATADTPRDVFEGELRLERVEFSYDPGSAPALTDVDLTIRRGEFIGICGPTGGGKSTLVDLIAGLLRPTAGQVLVDGKQLEDYSPWWWQQLGVVSQSIFLVDDSLKNNIALGRPPGKIDDERLHNAVRRSQLDTVVRDLPDGLETPVGERGIRLSGGQRQRVAIARALYREPPVLILDEGTSALDSATESALVAALDELQSGRTVIAVAHRLSTVRHADRIIVVDHGRIIAEGAYDDLLEHSELFRELAR